METSAVIVCPHCPIMESKGVSHSKNCKCSHHHSKHNYGGGCKVKGCLCDQYDQTSGYKEPVKLKPIVMGSLAPFNQKPYDWKTNAEIVEKLTAAQIRVDGLKKKVLEMKADSSTAEPNLDKIVVGGSSPSPPTKEQE